MKEALRANIRSLLLTVLILSSSAFQSLAYYHPDEGRWLSRDPIGEQGSRNLYAFVGNNAIVLIDPYGLLQELTVALTAAGRDANTFAGWGRLLAGKNRQQFATGSDFINALRNWTHTLAEGFAADECTCVKNLYVISHGWTYQSSPGSGHGGGVFSTGQGSGPESSGFYGTIRTQQNDDGTQTRIDHADARSVDDLQADIGAGDIRFCSPCTIILTGCRIASTGTFATSLARATRCTVRAAAGQCSGTDAPQFTSGPGTFDERQAEGTRPWQEFVPVVTRDPQTGRETVDVTVREAGGSQTLW